MHRTDYNILLWVTRAYSITVLRSMYDYAQELSGSRVAYYSPAEFHRYLPEEAQKVDAIEAAIDYNPDMVFVPSNFVHKKVPGLKVQVFHGLCEEKPGHYDIRGYFDLYCTPGPLMTETMQDNRKKNAHYLIRETGWPKVDRILRPYDQTEVRKTLNLPVENPVILYAPTFSRRFKSTTDMAEVIRNVPGDGETWVIKFHDLMSDEDRAMFDESPNVVIYDHHDIVPLFHAADVLISDTSSVVYEFMLLDKPVITVNAIARQEKGIDISDISQFRDAVDQSLEKPDEYSEARQRIMDQMHPYRDTENARRVYEAADEVIANDLTANLPKKPGNWMHELKMLFSEKERLK